MPLGDVQHPYRVARLQVAPGVPLHREHVLPGRALGLAAAGLVGILQGPAPPVAHPDLPIRTVRAMVFEGGGVDADIHLDGADVKAGEYLLVVVRE